MKRIVIFLVVTFVLTWAYEFGVVYPVSAGGLAGVPVIAAQLVTGAAMFFPAIGALVTRLLTRERFKNSLIKPKGFRKSLPWFLVAWFGPALLAALGAALYYVVFPQDFDPTMSRMLASQQQAVAATGTEISEDLLHTSLLMQLSIAVVLGPSLIFSRRLAKGGAGAATCFQKWVQSCVLSPLS